MGLSEQLLFCPPYLRDAFNASIRLFFPFCRESKDFLDPSSLKELFGFKRLAARMNLCFFSSPDGSSLAFFPTLCFY